jgi:hypothetical protein
MRCLVTQFMRVLVLVGVLALAAGCSSAADPFTVVTPVGESQLSAGDAIPVPQDEVIVTVMGKIGNPNVDDSIQMDMETIESVGLVEYLVTDPFDTGDLTFQGPLMRDLLDLWGVPDDATILHMVALNDYAVDVPISDLREFPVIFAVKQDGEYMPISTRGPAMLVYPYNDFDFDHAVYDNYWIWQIKSIEVQ